MIPAKDIRDWQGEAVVDQSGAKIGTLEAVYFDTATQEPTFVTVKAGLPGISKLLFVPMLNATVSPRNIQVDIDKKLAKDAPSIDLNGELTADAEPGIYEHYGLTYTPGSGGERKLGRR
ncbi:MAG: PRC-barrel domain-containing protein [Propionibacteriaceae bacterium]